MAMSEGFRVILIPSWRTGALCRPSTYWYLISDGRSYGGVKDLGQQETRSTYMGEQTEATVHAAELQGTLLALIIILRHQIQHTVVFTDNQVALQAMQNPGRQSGQYILETILVAINKTRTIKLTICFQWIPSHSGVKGNE